MRAFCFNYWSGISPTHWLNDKTKIPYDTECISGFYIYISRMSADPWEERDFITVRRNHLCPWEECAHFVLIFDPGYHQLIGWMINYGMREMSQRSHSAQARCDDAIFYFFGWDERAAGNWYCSWLHPVFGMTPTTQLYSSRFWDDPDTWRTGTSIGSVEPGNMLSKNDNYNFATWSRSWNGRTENRIISSSRFWGDPKLLKNGDRFCMDKLCRSYPKCILFGLLFGPLWLANFVT